MQPVSHLIDNCLTAKTGSMPRLWSAISYQFNDCPEIKLGSRRTVA